MSVELLAAAMIDAGIDVDTLAERIQVDVRTVRRWVKGTIPYARHQNRIARALDTTARELWPEMHSDPDADAASDEPEDDAAAGRDAFGGFRAGDVVAVYAGVDDPQLPEWRELLAGAQSRVRLLDLTLTDIIDPASVVMLAQKAAEGCEVQILVSDPDSVHLTTAMFEDKPERSLTDLPDLTWAVERTIAQLQPLLGEDRVEVRSFVAEPGNTVLRFDEEMLVTLHLSGALPGRDPILHLVRRDQGGVFDRFSDHAARIASLAGMPLTPDPDRYPSPAAQPERYAPGDPPAFTSRPTGFAPEFNVPRTPDAEPKPRWRRRQ